MSTEDDRARRLAAIQARLAPPPPPASEGDADGSGGSGSVTPASAPPRHLPKPWRRPSEREEKEKRRELARILQRTIVRDSGYQQAATCVEILLKIANNIQTNPDPKFRTLKSDNNALRSKVFSIPGGRDFMIHMGFRTERRDFAEVFILDQSERRMFELGLAADVLKEALPSLQSRVTGTNLSKTSHKAEEAARIALAKRQIEEDRQLVSDRVERERIARDARAAAEAQAEAAKKAKEAIEEAEERRKRERAEEREKRSGAEGQTTRAHPTAAVNMSMGGSVPGHGSAGATATEDGDGDGDGEMDVDPDAGEAERIADISPDGDNGPGFDIHHDDEDEDDDYDSDEGYWNQHRWGSGQKLGQ